MNAYEAGRLVAAVAGAADATGRPLGAVVERFGLGRGGFLYIHGRDGRQVAVHRSGDTVEWVLLDGDPSGPRGAVEMGEGDGYASLDGPGARLARGIAEVLA